MDEFELKDVEMAVQSVIEKLPMHSTTSRPPVAIILGGQPGAGKTALQDVAKENFSNIVIINGDEYRKYHPNYEDILATYGKDFPEHTGKFSSSVTEMLIDRLIEQKRDILVEGTLRTAEAPLKTCRKCKENGYNTILGIMAVKPEISYLSTILRYESMMDIGMDARSTTREHHDNVVRNLPENLKVICESGEFTEVVVYNRQKQCISHNSPKRPYEVLREVLNGTWSRAELENYQTIYNKIIILKNKRNAHDLQDFIEEYGKIYANIENKMKEFDKNRDNG